MPRRTRNVRESYRSLPEVVKSKTQQGCRVAAQNLVSIISRYGSVVEERFTLYVVGIRPINRKQNLIGADFHDATEQSRNREISARRDEEILAKILSKTLL